MFGKSRAALAGAVVSLLVAGSTVFMASTAANAVDPALYELNKVIGYGENADGHHLANTLYNDIDAPAAEFNGKIITVDSDDHVFATDPVTNESVDLSASVWNPDGDVDTNDGNWFNFSYGVTGGITSIQYDGKFWLWVYDRQEDGYDLFYSDGTPANSGVIQMETGEGAGISNYPDYAQTIGIDGDVDGIYFVVQENAPWRDDLYFWDGTISGDVGNAVDMDVDANTADSEVFALRELDGYASFIVSSDTSLDQYYASDENEVAVAGPIVTPGGHSETDGWIEMEDLYWSGETSANAYVQVRWENDTNWDDWDEYVLTTTGYNTLYTVVEDSVDQIDTGDAIVFDDAFFLEGESGELVKIEGTTVSTLGSGFFNPEMFVVDGDTLYFAADSSDNGSWGIHSVTSAGVHEEIINDWDEDGYDNVVGAAVNGKFFFQQYSDEHEYELWVHDADGTRLAVDYNTEFGTWNNSSYPYYFSTIGGKAYISAYNWVTGYDEMYTVGTGSALPAVGTLAEGNSMYALSCDGDTPSFTAVDAATAERTDLANEAHPTDDCFGQAAYDPTTGLSYAVDFAYLEPALVQINLETGLRTFVGTFKEYFTNDNGTSLDTSDDYLDSNWIDIESIAIDNDGIAYVMDYDGVLFTVDLETAKVEEIGDLNVDDVALYDGVFNFPDGVGNYALAVDPTTNTLYGAEYSEGQSTIVYSINKSTAEITVVGNWATATAGTEENVRSMQFDTDGTLWIVNDCGAYTDYNQDECGNDSLWTVTDVENFNETAAKVSDFTYYGENRYDNGVGRLRSLLVTRGDENNFPAGAQPATDTLYSLNCDGSVNPYLLTNVSKTDASGTGVGADTVDNNACFSQGAWNPVTKKAYAVDWNYDGYHGLAEINVENGRSTFIGEFRSVDPDTSESTFLGGYAIAIDNDGNAFVWYSDTLYSLDLETAIVEEIGASDVNNAIYAMAVNPLNNKLYAIEDSGDHKYFEVNKATGALTQLGTYDEEIIGDTIESLQFDGSGVAYIQVDDNTLWKGAITAGPNTFTKIGTFTVDVDGEDVEYFTESLLYVPGTGGLASTGVDSSIATTAALGGLLALAAGVTIVARRRRATA